MENRGSSDEVKGQIESSSSYSNLNSESGIHDLNDSQRHDSFPNSRLCRIGSSTNFQDGHFTDEETLKSKEENKYDETLNRFMLKEWKIPTPNAVMSIISGSGDFRIRNRYKDRLQQGFVKAAKNGVWILTDEYRDDVLSIIEGALFDKEKKSKDQLEKNKSLIVFSSSKNEASSEKKNIHPRFVIPIDNDDKRSLQDFKIGLEFFISKLDKNIVEQGDQLKSTPIRIPVVAVLCEGNIDTLQYTLKYIEEGIPVLVIKGSGGAADFFVEIVSQLSGERTRSSEGIVESIFQDCFGPIKSPNLDIDFSNLIHSKRGMIHVYSIEDTEKTLDIVLQNILFKEYKHGDVPSTPSYGVYISQLVRFACICCNIDDFNERKQIIANKLLQQGYRFHNIVTTFGIFHKRYRELKPKFDATRKKLIVGGISHPSFYCSIVNKAKCLKS